MFRAVIQRRGKFALKFIPVRGRKRQFTRNKFLDEVEIYPREGTETR